MEPKLHCPGVILDNGASLEGGTQGWHIGSGRYSIDQYRQNQYIGIGDSTSADISADIHISKSFHIS